jgi:hypothetical protein
VRGSASEAASVCVVWNVWCGMNDGETARWRVALMTGCPWGSAHLRSGECQMVVLREVKAGNKECGLVAGMKGGAEFLLVRIKCWPRSGARLTVVPGRHRY